MTPPFYNVLGAVANHKTKILQKLNHAIPAKFEWFGTKLTEIHSVVLTRV